MANKNMFDAVFEKPALVSEAAPAPAEQPRERAKGEGLFSLKDLPASSRKPTTIIFSKENYIRLKKLAVDANLNMSEVVNRWLEGLEAGE